MPHSLFNHESTRRRLIWASILALTAVVVSAAPAAEVITYPFQGVRHIHRTESVPRELSIHIVEVDLKAPGIGFRVTPPSPQYPNLTLSQTTRDFLVEQNAQVAINGDFFSFATPPGFPYANVLHLAASDGVGYSPFNGAEPALHLARNNVGTVVRRDGSVPPGYATSPPVDLWNAVGGNEYIVFNGVNTANWNELHPRTAAGITADQRLLLFTVDGRNVGHSRGMTTPEVADMLISYGATHAINLDGGGSTTLAMADPAPRVVNVPVDGSPGSERRNGNNLAVFAWPAPPPVPDDAQQRNYKQETGVYSHVATHIRSGLPNFSYGNDSLLRVGHMQSGGIQRSILAFDLADIPSGSTIHSVELTLHATSVIGSAGQYIDMELHTLEGEIVETEASWNRPRAGVTWNSPGGDFGGGPLSTLYGQNTSGYKTFVSTARFVEAAQQALDEGGPLSMIVTAPWTESLTGDRYMLFASDDNANLAQRPVFSVQYTPPLALLAGDFNGDGIVDATDYVVWRDGLGTNYALEDYDDWKNNYGAAASSAASIGPSGIAAVPEPASVAMLLVGTLAMFFRWRVADTLRHRNHSLPVEPR